MLQFCLHIFSEEVHCFYAVLKLFQDPKTMRNNGSVASTRRFFFSRCSVTGPSHSASGHGGECRAASGATAWVGVLTACCPQQAKGGVPWRKCDSDSVSGCRFKVFRCGHLPLLLITMYFYTILPHTPI